MGKITYLKKMNRSIPGAIQDTIQISKSKIWIFRQNKNPHSKKKPLVFYFDVVLQVYYLAFDLIFPARYLPRFGQNNAWGTAIREIDEVMKKFYIYDQGGR